MIQKRHEIELQQNNVHHEAVEDGCNVIVSVSDSETAL
jgi:hypothetical protein